MRNLFELSTEELKNIVATKAKTVTNQDQENYDKLIEEGKFSFEVIKKLLRDNGMVFVEKVARAISVSLEQKTSLLVYGPGGHGKSMIGEIIMQYLRDLSIKADVKPCSNQDDQEDFLGPIHMEFFRETGAQLHNGALSILNNQVCIFEEFLDIDSQTAESLKYVLEDKRLKTPIQEEKLPLQTVIAFTNKDLIEFKSQSDSCAAFGERFRNSLKLEWDNYNYINYKFFLTKIFPEQPVSLLEEFAKAVTAINEGLDGFIMSPRMVRHAFVNFSNYGAEAVELVNGIETPEMIYIVKQEFQALENIMESVKVFNNVDKDVMEVTQEIQNALEALKAKVEEDSLSVKEYHEGRKTIANKINVGKTSLSRKYMEIPCDETLLKKRKEKLRSLEERFEELENELLESL